ncbi:MAG: nucleotidyltransferase domain-containing protein [Anaerolineae bacterium]|nr:nucleotidyltransferase domain-containing protein [Anaerolineae bacterium]
MKIQEAFIERFAQWAGDQSDIQAVALVGSYARGTAREDSDVDLVIVTSDPKLYLNDNAWVDSFGSVQSIQHEDWGLVQSKRVMYEGGLEVEFGITTTEWTQTEAVDPGTAAVVSDGMRILYDPHGVLHALQTAVDRR